MAQLFTLLLILSVPTEIPENIQLTNDKQFKLDGFTIRDTYILNDKERFVVAAQLTTDKTGFGGLRFLYIRENRIEFKSKDIGESYIYRPTFYRFKDNSLLIVCEQGFEYSIGVDVFGLKEGKIEVIGNMDVASNTNDHAQSIVPNMTIERKYGDQYNFKFKGEIVINPGGKHERKISGELITGIYLKETRMISLMIKSE